MKALDDFLTSGHEFSENENLQKFSFSLLNSLLFIASIFTLLNYFSSKLNLVTFAPLYDKVLLFFTFSCLFSIFVLRQRKRNYIFAANCVVLSSLVLFYTALFVVKHDEFRLIWFFLVVLASFVLLGKKYGLVLTVLILAAVFIINEIYNLGFSDLALFTFFNSLLIFMAFIYFFREKIEKDAHEFALLNDKLEVKIREEIQQRKEQEQMLLRQYRMANMGEMIDSIAHQWRQPLMHINSILMNMQSALEGGQKNEIYLETKIDDLASLTEHMSQTIEGFRGLLRAEDTQKEFSLNEAIKDVIALMKNNFNNIDLVYDADKEFSMMGYRNELMQVFIILLANAIEVLDKREVKNKKITIKTGSIRDNVFITVEDNAGGITPENLNSIFDPYFTTKEQSGGTGLGLYIAKIIVEHKMSGQITVTNTKIVAKFRVMIFSQTPKTNTETNTEINTEINTETGTQATTGDTHEIHS